MLGSIEGFELLDVVLLSQVLRNRLVVIGGVVDRGVEPVVMGNPIPGRTYASAQDRVEVSNHGNWSALTSNTPAMQTSDPTVARSVIRRSADGIAGRGMRLHGGHTSTM